VFKITAFNRQTTERVAERLASLQKPGAPPLGGIVLDLRNNPGGILEQAVSLADLFIAKGPIVSTTGRHPAAYQKFVATGRAPAPQVPMAVLINGASASSAEIVASALQDDGRAIVLGSSSYGKGTVQTVMRMPNDGELILTWARLVTPAGYRLNRHGVVPTVCTAGAGSAGSGPRVTALGGLRPRSSLDDEAWIELRNACPPTSVSPPGDLKLAAQLLADPKLYADALHSLPIGAAPQQSAAAPPVPSPALTGVNRTLSFETR
jgi:carboxyl-terminal processing protease